MWKKIKLEFTCMRTFTADIRLSDKMFSQIVTFKRCKIHPLHRKCTKISSTEHLQVLEDVSSNVFSVLIRMFLSVLNNSLPTVGKATTVFARQKEPEQNLWGVLSSLRGCCNPLIQELTEKLKTRCFVPCKRAFVQTIRTT